MQKDLSQLQVLIHEEIALVRADMALLRADFTGLRKELSFCATKADLRGLERSIKGWMSGVAVTVMSVNFAMNVIFLNFQKEAAAIAAAKAQISAPIQPPRATPAPGPASPVK